MEGNYYYIKKQICSLVTPVGLTVQQIFFVRSFYNKEIKIWLHCIGSEA